MRLNYILIPLATILVGYVGSQFTSQGIGGWYQSLHKPSLTPPGNVIGMVWTVIYVLTTISALKLYNLHFRNFQWFCLMLLYIGNAGLNVYWSYLFFSQHMLEMALLEMLALEGTVLLLITLSWRYSKSAALLLVPYAIWVGYASYLTYTIIILN